MIGINWFLFKTRAGLTLRSVGDNHKSAHSLGIDVIKIRYLAVMFGGACSGLAGAHLALVYVPQWVEGMTAGRGWIALALVVFASWRPWRILVGAYLFGGVTIAPVAHTGNRHQQPVIPAVMVVLHRRIDQIDTFPVFVVTALCCDNCSSGYYIKKPPVNVNQYSRFSWQRLCAGSLRQISISVWKLNFRKHI